MPKSVQQLKDRLVELQETGKAIQAKADAENRDLNVEEQKELDDIFNEFEGIEADIGRRDRLAAQDTRMAASAGRAVDPEPTAAQAAAADPAEPRRPARKPGVGMQRSNLPTLEERQRWGFRDFGEFCMKVKEGALNPSGLDSRLIQNAVTTYGAEGVGADGGFAIPPEWRSEIVDVVFAEDGLIGRTDQQVSTSNSITFPVDETTAWQTTGGILAYWDSEAAAMTQTKPALKDLTIKLGRLTCLVPVTEELLEDAPALGGYVAGKAGEKMSFKLNDALVNGTGAGQPLGILSAPCTVQVAKETSQTATTFKAENAVNMMARLPASSFAKAVWLINQDVLPQILKAGFAITTPSGTAAGAGALYLPPGQLSGGLQESPYGLLLGRPLVVTEACQSLGSVGDVILADMSKYLSVTKAGGIRSDVSMHLFFDQNVTAFRFVLRMAGQPWLSAAIVRKNGTNTLSHFVTCAAR